MALAGDERGGGQPASGLHAVAVGGAVGAGFHHGAGRGGGAYSARGLEFCPVPDYATQQRNIFHGGWAHKAGSGLDKVGLGGEREFAAQDFFFQRQDRRFQNHLHQSSAGVSNLTYGGNVILHRLPVTRFQHPDIHHHVELVRAGADSFSSFKAFDRRVVGAKRKAIHGGDSHGSAAQNCGTQVDPPWVHAHGGKAVISSLFTKMDNLFTRSLWL